jgi:hypothetical protein
MPLATIQTNSHHKSTDALLQYYQPNSSVLNAPSLAMSGMIQPESRTSVNAPALSPLPQHPCSSNALATSAPLTGSSSFLADALALHQLLYCNKPPVK